MSRHYFSNEKGLSGNKSKNSTEAETGQDQHCQSPPASAPVPEREWPAVERILGLESTAQLVGVSVSSARGYFAGTRTTPDAVAARLHFLAFVVGDLAGAYNDVGVRRWFHRPRTLLNGNTPARLLEGDWGPDDDGPRQVRDLAAALGPSPVT